MQEHKEDAQKEKDVDKTAQEYLEGWQRAKADYQNLKKQVEKEKAEIGTFARAAVLVQLVPILENLRRAFTHVPKKDKKIEWVVGLQHIEKQITELLEQHGLKEIDAKGKEFDPTFHEAVTKEKHNGAKSGTILDVVSSGWMYGENVLIPSKVKVAE